MLTMKAVRTQADGKQAQYSDEAGLDCKDPSLARQEDAQAADINYILGRFGIGNYTDKTPYYTETNYNIGLQDAVEAARAATTAWGRLPKEIHDKYVDYFQFAQAVASGEYEATMKAEDQAIADQATHDANQRAFLKTKGLTDAEIDRTMTPGTTT